METTVTLATYLEGLKDGSKAVVTSGLVNLSDLTPEEISLLRQNWLSIGARKRNDIIKKLVQLAEENFELNFDNVFACCAADPEGSVRVKAAEGLGESDSPAFVDVLLRLLDNDDEASVRAAAASSLAGFCVKAEVARVKPRYADRLGETLLAVAGNKSEDIEVRRRALESAGALSLSEVKWAIREAYESASHVLKASAIYAMGKNCDPVWLPIVIEELSSDDPEIRYESATACGEIGEEEAVDHLIPMTGDTDLQVQLAAMDALAKIGGDVAKTALQECARSEDPRISDAAGEALQYLAAEEDPLSLTREA